MLRQHAVPQHVEEHALRAIGRDVAEALVIVLAVLAAEVPEVIEEVAGKQADADAQLQYEDLRLQCPVGVGGRQRGEEHLGSVPGGGPSLLMTKGTGEASEMNALLPRCRR